MLDPGAIGAHLRAENPLGVQPLGVPFCPAMKLYISNVLPQDSIRNYGNYPVTLQISTGTVAGRMSSELARHSLTTDQLPEELRMMPLPFGHQELQLGGAATAPTVAAFDSINAVGGAPESPLPRGSLDPSKRSARGVGRRASSMSRRWASTGLRVVGRERSPLRRWHAPSRPTSPRTAPTAPGPRVSLAGEEGIAGGRVRDDGFEAVRERFGTLFPSAIRIPRPFDT